MTLDNNLKLEILNNIAHLEGYRTCLYHYSDGLGLFQEGDVKDTIKSIDESIAHLRQELKKKKEEDTTAKCVSCGVTENLKLCPGYEYFYWCPKCFNEICQNQQT